MDLFIFPEDRDNPGQNDVYDDLMSGRTTDSLSDNSKTNTKNSTSIQREMDNTVLEKGEKNSFTTPNVNPKSRTSSNSEDWENFNINLEDESRDKNVPSNGDVRKKHRKTFSKKIPTTPEETWDFSLHADDPGYSKKCIWIEGSFYQKFKAECLHEMHHVSCGCEEKKKVSMCRLCHEFFCSNKCFKRTREELSKTTTQDSPKDETLVTASSGVVDDNLEPDKGFEKQSDQHPMGPNNVIQAAKTNEAAVQQTQSIPTPTLSDQHQKKQFKHYRQKTGFGKMPGKETENLQTFNNGFALPPRNLWPTHLFRPNNVPPPHPSMAPPLPVGAFPPRLERESGSAQAYAHMNASVPFQPNCLPGSPPRPPNPEGNQTLNIVNDVMLQSNPYQNSYVSQQDENAHSHSLASMKTERVGESFRNYETPVKLFRNPGPVRVSEESGSFSNVQTRTGNQTAHSGAFSNEHPSVEKNHNQSRFSTDKNSFNDQSGQYHRASSNEYSSYSSDQSQQARFPVDKNRLNERNRQGQKDRTSQSLPMDREPFTDFSVLQKSGSSVSSGGPRDRQSHRGNASEFTSNYSSDNKNNYNESQNVCQANARTNASDLQATEPNLSIAAHQDQQRRRHTESLPKNEDMRTASNSFAGKRQKADFTNRKFNNKNRPNANAQHHSKAEGGNFVRHEQSKNENQISVPPKSEKGAIKGGKFSTRTRSQPITTPSHVRGNLNVANKKVDEELPLQTIAAMSLTPLKKEKISPLKSTIEGVATASNQDLIQDGPAIPIGVLLPVTYVYGENFHDMSVMTSKNMEVFETLHQALQSCGKFPMDVMELGKFCLVMYGPRKEWYRGVITQVSNPKYIRVFLLDYGLSISVHSNSINQLPNEFKSYRPLAIRMRCLNIEIDPEEEADAAQHFDSLIRGQRLKIRITHRDNSERYKFAGSLEVMHINKWYDVGDYLEKLLVGTKPSQEEISQEEQRGRIVPLKLSSMESSFKDLGSFGQRREILVTLTHVVNLNEFYVATRESVQRKAKVEGDLNRLDVLNTQKTLKSLVELSHLYFAMFDEDLDMWVRVAVLEVSSEDEETVIVFKPETGEKQTVRIDSLRFLPEHLKNAPSCVYKCSLPVKPFRRNKSDIEHQVIDILKTRIGQRLKAVVLSVENGSLNLVELFFGSDLSGCTSDFLNKGWIQLTNNYDLSRPVNA